MQAGQLAPLNSGRAATDQPDPNITMALRQQGASAIGLGADAPQE